ncbi:hypothetical protein PFISCL1PPCAC_6664, partial [Pristionchus fissidentatus]
LLFHFILINFSLKIDSLVAKIDISMNRLLFQVRDPSFCVFDLLFCDILCVDSLESIHNLHIVILVPRGTYPHPSETTTD